MRNRCRIPRGDSEMFAAAKAQIAALHLRVAQSTGAENDVTGWSGDVGLAASSGASFWRHR
jgi:hypothetical protein